MAINPDGSPTYFPIPQLAFNKALSTVQAAQTAWMMMVTEFAAENLAMGVTPAQEAAIGSSLIEVMTYGTQGLLVLAFGALSSVIIPTGVDPFLTPDRIQWMKNKIITILVQL